ncbi:MAG: DUF2975 domain-containing protein [Eubacteriaceae bacterium]|nr:DUF2975 domain-containing protein [Eubacteriaceae bacterium]
MSSKSLANLMKLSICATTTCALFLCLIVIPEWGKGLVASRPEFLGWFWPWLVFAWLVSMPLFMILVLIWKVSNAVMLESVFTLRTASWVKIGAMLMLFDAVFLVLGNIALLVAGMNHPGMLVFCCIAAIFAIALGVLAAVLSRYLTKAAILQEEADGTL